MKLDQSSGAGPWDAPLTPKGRPGGPASRTISVLREGLEVTSIGTLIGLFGAVTLSRFLTSMVFGITALDPRVMLGAVAFMMVVAAMAAYLPAYRATAAEPRSVLQ